jgi:hypothetical protein
VRLWDVKTGQLKATIQGTRSPVAFSPDNEALATSSPNNLVLLWDVGPGRTRTVLRGEKPLAASVGFSADGRRVFGQDGGGTVLAWSVADGQPTDPGEPPTIPACPTSVSPDGTVRAEVSGSAVWLVDLDAALRDRDDRLAVEARNRPWRHQRQAAQAEKDHDWFAAAFHLGRLLKDNPGDANLLRRRDLALEKLKPPPRMEPLSQP